MLTVTIFICFLKLIAKQNVTQCVESFTESSDNKNFKTELCDCTE